MSQAWPWIATAICRGFLLCTIVCGERSMFVLFMLVELLTITALFNFSFHNYLKFLHNSHNSQTVPKWQVIFACTCVHTCYSSWLTEANWPLRTIFTPHPGTLLFYFYAFFFINSSNYCNNAIELYLFKSKCSIMLGPRVAQWVRSLDLTAHTSLSSIWRGFASSFVNYEKGALNPQPQVIKFTSCLPPGSVVLSGYSGFFHH